MLNGKMVELSFHAEKRMLERRISLEQILKVIEKPDTEGKARTKGCRRVERRLGRRTFGVVYQEERRTIRVITVW